MSASVIIEAKRLLAERKFEEVTGLLGPVANNGASAEVHGLLGVAEFYSEK